MRKFFLLICLLFFSCHQSTPPPFSLSFQKNPTNPYNHASCSSWSRNRQVRGASINNLFFFPPSFSVPRGRCGFFERVFIFIFIFFNFRFIFGGSGLRIFPSFLKFNYGHLLSLFFAFSSILMNFFMPFGDFEKLLSLAATFFLLLYAQNCERVGFHF